MGATRLLMDSLTKPLHRRVQHNMPFRWRCDIRTFAQKFTSTLRIMPLGGSITYGLQSSDGNGYRQALHEMLVSDGYIVDMVGSRKNGSMEDNDHEGWRGFRIDQVTNKARNSIYKCLPQLVLVNVGSNDCIQNFQIEKAGERMACLLKYLWEAAPYSTVILSTLLTNLDDSVDSRVLRVNDQFRELVLKNAGEGKRVILADMYGPGGVETSDLADGTHPNDVGYAKMANIWRGSIHEAVIKNFMSKPLHKSSHL